ncbi:DUF7472 family protein [Haloferacaceae archaeon DSL9]
MEIDAQVRRQIVVSVAAVGLFLTVVVGIGMNYNGGSGLPETGAIALVGSLFGFIVLMALVGFFLSRR